MFDSICMLCGLLLFGEAMLTEASAVAFCCAGALIGIPMLRLTSSERYLEKQAKPSRRLSARERFLADDRFAFEGIQDFEAALEREMDFPVKRPIGYVDRATGKTVLLGEVIDTGDTAAAVTEWFYGVKDTNLYRSGPGTLSTDGPLDWARVPPSAFDTDDILE